MAVLPYFILGPNTILSLFGLLHGPDKTMPTPNEDWRQIKVDVVIPAYNEENTIILCLESLRHQTLQPHRIVLIDDGSKDRTAEIARTFSETVGMPLEVVRHRKSVGKTPGVKQEARELDGDVEFVLDGDTILESTNYIERLVQELYQGVGIASACGVVMPLREKHRHKMAENSPVEKFYKERPELTYLRDAAFFHKAMRAVTNIYREFLYFFLQRLIYRGYMTLFGSIVNPVGCAVAYRREYIKDLFAEYEAALGDNLTTSEDIFIGFALLDQGYRNIQVPDVQARSEEPEAQSVPHQIFMWSSSFFQSCYYFPDLLMSPFKVFRRIKHAWQERKDSGAERRKTPEAYRQAFGKAYTKQYGRPIGWAIFLPLLEKITFPLFILYMIVFRHFNALALTLAAETLTLLLLTTLVSQRYRLRYALLALVATPLRYGAIMFDVIAMARFIADISVFKNHHWRK